MSTTTVDGFAAVNATSAAAPPATKNDAGSADRFLKLLVTQLKNQDPLNPMDNAQITSQMAQINTVSGIDKLNTTVASLGTQMLQSQALQGAALVGHDVTIVGDGLSISDSVGVAGFELAGPADHVKVEVLDPSGRVQDTLELGAQTTGRHGFEWPAPGIADGSNYHFRVTATKGAAVVQTTLLSRDRVNAVSTDGDTLTLELQRNGSTPYSQVKSIN